eukprot:539257-Pyramimonas_sp.AAC.1
MDTTPPLPPPMGVAERVWQLFDTALISTLLANCPELLGSMPPEPRDMHTQESGMIKEGLAVMLSARKETSERI